jgi:hypothetical protein
MLCLALAQSVSWSYQRYLRIQGLADDQLHAEALCRQKANVCEEMSPKLREVAALANEMAKSATSQFERTKWLNMAKAEEAKAVRFEHQAIELMGRADVLASQAVELSRAAWRPWVDTGD